MTDDKWWQKLTLPLQGELKIRSISSHGVPPLTYKRFQAILSKMDSPKQPEDTITSEDIGSTKTPISDELTVI
jgi:hypothetical protein